jgi:hypothetical protein
MAVVREPSFAKSRSDTMPNDDHTPQDAREDDLIDELVARSCTSEIQAAAMRTLANLANVFACADNHALVYAIREIDPGEFAVLAKGARVG